jgi:hypothetical protein
MIRCIKCLQEKDETMFYLRPNGNPYYTCKPCKNQYAREQHHLKSKDLQWRINRSESNKKRYHDSRNN